MLIISFFIVCSCCIVFVIFVIIFFIALCNIVKKYNDKESTTDAQEKAKLYQKWTEDVKIINRTLW